MEDSCAAPLQVQAAWRREGGREGGMRIERIRLELQIQQIR
jgi:hypothetical protein